MNPLALRDDPANPAIPDAELWASAYGVRYTMKFHVDWMQRVAFLKRILKITGARTILDVGTNVGWNLLALYTIDPTLTLHGNEINEHSAFAAASHGFKVIVGPAKDIAAAVQQRYYLVMHSGVLIHVPDSELKATMASIIALSHRRVLAIEYGAPKKTCTVKHGKAERCWARPYGKLYADMGLKIAEAGDADGYVDCRYWLMEKP